MAKYTLSLEDDFNFDLIGLCSHLADYRVCWAINERFELKLEKSIEPFMVSGKKGEVISKHSLYEDSSNEEVSYYFIQNKDGANFLVPERAQIDYFLVIKDAGAVDVEELLSGLKALTCVLTAFIFDPYELKSANKFIF